MAEGTKYHFTLLLAERKLNSFMTSFDMRPNFKWFYAPTEVEVTTTTQINSEYFQKIIRESKNLPDYWIPGIIYAGELYVDPEVKILSDGVKEMFVN